MPVSSLVVEVRPGAEAAVAQQLGTLGGLEVLGVENGRIIAVTDTSSIAADRALTARVEELEDVLTVAVVFYSMEDCVADVAKE